MTFDEWWSENQDKIYRAMAESLPGNDYRYTMEKKFHDAYNQGWKSAVDYFGIGKPKISEVEE